MYAAEYWRRRDASHFIAEFIDDYPVIVTEESLINEHPLLPLAMDEMIRRQNQGLFRNSGLQGDYVYYTLEVLKNNVISLPDIDGELMLMSEIMELATRTESLNIVDIKGVAIWIQTFEYQSKPVPLVVHTETTSLSTFESSLSEMYPEWEKRWRIGCEIGMKKSELARHAFSHQNISCIKPLMPDSDLL